MNASEVKNLPWISVTDWNELTKTHFNTWGTPFVGKEDVEMFVENVFRDIARKLNISYADLESILREENSPFYSTMHRLFRNYDGISKNDSQLVEVEKLLRIPDVTSVSSHIKSNVDKMMNDFSTLTDAEKPELLQRLGIISITIKL